MERACAARATMRSRLGRSVNRDAAAAVHLPTGGAPMVRDHGRLEGRELDVRAAYAAHGAELYRFALRQLGDGGAAQDVVQEVFLRAWRSADAYDPRLASLRTWLFAIARNVVVDEARRLSARPRGATTDAGPGARGPA